VNLKPHQPERPFIWPDVVYELQAQLAAWPHPVYIVGGAVRDAMLHRSLKDLDLATPLDGIKLARQIANQFDGDFFPLDPDRDVGRALIDTPEGRLLVDVARLRGTDLLADLTDRDFTLNAMAVDLKGDLNLVIDPLGGETDLARKLLCRCAPHSISSDPIRALRAVRQSLQFGLRLDEATVQDVRAAHSGLAAASPERLRDELFKLLTLPRPAAGIRVADRLGLLEVLLPELTALHGLLQSQPHQRDAWEHTLAVTEHLTGLLNAISYSRTDSTAASFQYGMVVIQLDRFRGGLAAHLEQEWPNERPHRALLLLGALFHDAGKPAVAVQDADGGWSWPDHHTVGVKLARQRGDALRLSADEIMRLAVMVDHHQAVWSIDPADPRALHRFWRRCGPAGVDICLLTLADYLGGAGEELNQDEWLWLVDRVRLLLEAYFLRYDQLVEPVMLLDGSQLMEELGLKPGKRIGELLTLIREAQVAGEIHTPAQALELARRALTEPSS
jgi:tRNA nucleotidyltransferase/poly(A) polymerase